MEKQSVTIVDVDISFAQMVTLMVKFAFACIPAAIIIAFISAVFMGVFSLFGLALSK